MGVNSGVVPDYQSWTLGGVEVVGSSVGAIFRTQFGGSELVKARLLSHANRTSVYQELDAPKA